MGDHLEIRMLLEHRSIDFGAPVALAPPFFVIARPAGIFQLDFA